MWGCSWVWRAETIGDAETGRRWGSRTRVGEIGHVGSVLVGRVGTSTVVGPLTTSSPVGTRTEAASTPTFLGGRGVGDDTVVIFTKGDTDSLGCVTTDFDTPSEADPDSTNDSNDTDEELIETRGTLVDVKSEGLHVEFEENSGCALIVDDFAVVVRDAVLVGTKRPRTSGVVGGWDHGDEILINWECLAGNLQGVVKRLDDVGEEGTK